MKYGINLNSLLPVRAETNERSEMTTQLIFGETFTYEESSNGFCNITNDTDNYSGMADKKMITEITKEEYKELNQQKKYYIAVPLAEAFDQVNKHIIRLPAGSPLPNCTDLGTFHMHERKYQIHRDFILHKSLLTSNELLSTATSFINTPYLWGGKSVLGMDCSGFVQVVFSLHGHNLKRDAKEQALAGEPISFDKIIPEDLLFFSNDQVKITHVGIYLGDGKIIHSSGIVKIDKIDERGIYSEEFGQYTHQFHSARRLYSKR